MWESGTCLALAVCVAIAVSAALTTCLASGFLAETLLLKETRVRVFGIGVFIAKRSTDCRLCWTPSLFRGVFH